MTDALNTFLLINKKEYRRRIGKERNGELEKGGQNTMLVK